jgi:hypothetical protein
MVRTVLIGLFSALGLQVQVLDEYLEALARTAATFATTAPGLTAQETLDQRGRRGFIETLRGKKGEIKKFDVTLPEDFRTHHVVSRYALAEIGEGHVLHEIRTAVTMDGKSLATPDEARRALITGLRSADDVTKRKLLDDLEGAATDFGQLILLFDKLPQKDYDSSLAGEQHLGGEPVVVLGYRQISGTQGLTVFKETTEDRQPATGQIWLRRTDLLTVRIIMNTEESLSKKFTIRTEATVDYMPSPFGLVPESVIHKQSLNSSLMVENDFHFTDFNHENVRIA